MDTIEKHQPAMPSLDEPCTTTDAPPPLDAGDVHEPFMDLGENDQALFEKAFPINPFEVPGNTFCSNGCCTAKRLGSTSVESAKATSAGFGSFEAGQAEAELPDLDAINSDETGGSATLERVAEIAGVRLTRRGQVFFVPVEKETIRIGTKVLVELEQGIALTEVVSIFYKDQGVRREIFPLDGTIIGLATAKDIAAHAENKLLADEAEAFCKTCIRQRSLDMKQVDVAVLHDRSKIIFFFTAPARIDFRELVKDLVRCYRTRIELRQIGVRHETQMLGGIGNCGRVCCCHNYLRKFAPVTIKMAKEQNLFLNPAKLSGLCGRLLCCLSFEQANYEEFNRRCPRLGKRYTTDEAMVRIVRTNLFSQTIVVQADGEEEKEYTLDVWESLHPQRQEKFDRPDRNDRHATHGESHEDSHKDRRNRKNIHQSHLNTLANDNDPAAEEALAVLEMPEPGQTAPAAQKPAFFANNAPHNGSGKTNDGSREEGQSRRPRHNRPPQGGFTPNNNRPKRKRST